MLQGEILLEKSKKFKFCKKNHKHSHLNKIRKKFNIKSIKLMLQGENPLIKWLNYYKKKFKKISQNIQTHPTLISCCVFHFI